MYNFKHDIHKILLLAVILFCAGWLLYANTLSNRFAFDDKSLIVENRFVNDSYTLKEVFSTNYRYGSGFTGDGLYRPLVILSFILNKNKTLNPGSFHFFNITLNALNSVLLFLLLISLTGNVKVSFISALIFSLHPVHTEAVANNAGRPELMCAFFMFFTWILSEKLKNIWLLSIFPSFFLFAALLSKETAVMLPLMVFTVDLVLQRPLKKKRTLLKYVFMVVTIAVYLTLRWSFLRNITLGFEPNFVDNPIAGSPFVERVATAFGVLLRYCFLLVCPVRLSSDYSYNQLTIYSTFFHIIPITALAILVCFGVVFIFYKKHKPLFLISITLFLFPYFLISNIVFPIGTIMGERLMYIPLAGFSLALGSVIVRMMHRWRYPVLAVFSMLLIAYSLKTFTRNREWFDDFSLFSADLENAPRSVKVLCNMGFLSGKKGNQRAGEHFYRKALEIYPASDAALLGLGKNLYDQRRFKESARYYSKAAVLYPGKARVHYDYGTVLDKLGRFDEAEKELLIAIRLNPDNPRPFEALGAVYIAQGKYNDAIFCLMKAMELGGNMQIILNNLAAASYMGGYHEEAFEYIKKAEVLGIQLNPDMVNTIKSHFNSR